MFALLGIRKLLGNFNFYGFKIMALTQETFQFTSRYCLTKNVKSQTFWILIHIRPFEKNKDSIQPRKNKVVGKMKLS